jgi:hypothetical protein
MFQEPFELKTLMWMLKKSLAADINSALRINRHLIKQLVDGSANHRAQKRYFKISHKISGQERRVISLLMKHFFFRNNLGRIVCIAGQCGV